MIDYHVNDMATLFTQTIAKRKSFVEFFFLPRIKVYLIRRKLKFQCRHIEKIIVWMIHLRKLKVILFKLKFLRCWCQQANQECYNKKKKYLHLLVSVIKIALKRL